MIKLTKKEMAFTLAEVLITLAIIGIVAVLTIPTLVANYQERSWNTASDVFQRKLGEALKVMNVQGTLAGYTTTEAFVNELSKHIKITRVCQNDDITSCFADTVTWGDEEVDITEIKNAKNFGQNDWNTNTVGVQFANGVNGIIAYNPGCVQNPYSNQITGTSCLAILYDVDGFKNPNTEQKDLKGININSLGSSNCSLQLDGVCFTLPFLLNESLSYEECMEHKDEWQIKYCIPGNDSWGGVVKKCGGTQNMPTAQDLDKLVEYLYDTDDGDMNFAKLVYEFGGGSIDFLPIPYYVAFTIFTKDEKIEGGEYISDVYAFFETGSMVGSDSRGEYSGVTGLCIAN